jgi:hypothetical protein
VLEVKRENEGLAQKSLPVETNSDTYFKTYLVNLFVLKHSVYLCTLYFISVIKTIYFLAPGQEVELCI